MNQAGQAWIEALQVVSSRIPPVKTCNDGAGSAIFLQVGTCACNFYTSNPDKFFCQGLQ